MLDLRTQESIFPLVGVAVLISYFIFSGINRPVGLLLFFVIGYTFISFTVSGYSVMLYAVLYGVLYLLTVKYYGEIERRKTLIFNLLCLLCVLNVVWLVLQHFNIFFIFYPRRNYVNDVHTGWFANQSEVAVFLAACLPFFFRGKWHWGIPFVLAGLMLARNTTGMIAASLVLAVHGLILLWKRSRYLALCAFLVVLIAIPAIYDKYVHGGGVSVRLEAWSRASDLIVEKPLFGWGIGQSRFVVPLYLNADLLPVQSVMAMHQNVSDKEALKRLYLEHPDRFRGDSKIWDALHNDMMQWAIDSGIVGLMLMLLVIASHIRSFIKTRNRDLMISLSVAVFFLTSLSFFTFQIGRFMFLSVIMLGLIQGAYKCQDQQ